MQCAVLPSVNELITVTCFKCFSCLSVVRSVECPALCLLGVVVVVMYRKSISLPITPDLLDHVDGDDFEKLASTYGVTRNQLMDLVENRESARQHIQDKFKSVGRLCKLLKTDPVQGK